MRALFPKTTLVSVIGTAFFAACMIFMVTWTIHDPSGLADEGINPKTGLRWTPTTFDLVFGYTCGSFVVVIAVYCTIRELVEYLGLRWQRGAATNVTRKSIKRRIGYTAILMVSLGWIQSYLYPIAISRFFPSDSSDEFYVDSGYGVIEIPLYTLFGERTAFRQPLQVQHYTLEPDDPRRPHHSFQFIFPADPQFPTYRILEIPYWCLALCMLLIFALLPRRRFAGANSGFPLGTNRLDSGPARKG